MPTANQFDPVLVHETVRIAAGQTTADFDKKGCDIVGIYYPAGMGTGVNLLTFNARPADTAGWSPVYDGSLARVSYTLQNAGGSFGLVDVMELSFAQDVQLVLNTATGINADFIVVMRPVN